MSWFEDTVSRKKRALSRQVEAPLEKLAAHCNASWGDFDCMDACLRQGLESLPRCSLLYALDPEGIQVSSNVSLTGIQACWRGQDLASRPYLQGTLPYLGLLLSNAYLSQRSLEPCISAVHAVRNGAEILGFLVADFNLRDLSLDEDHTEEGASPGLNWEQFKGDPAIRGAVFGQTRSLSLMDERIDVVLAMMNKMLRDHGVFHAKLHFSSARATLWSYDNPYEYHLHNIDQITDPELCIVYPRRPWPTRAVVDPDQLPVALGYMKELRSADDTLYLRSGSINIINGMVGLNFSCDGSHYLPMDEFLNKDLAFWFGS